MKLTPFQWSAMHFFGYFGAYAVLLPFMPLWLKEQGYNTEIIGMLVAFGYLARFCGGLFFSQQVKQPNQIIPLARMMAWVSVLIVVLLAFSAQHIWLLVPVFALFHLFNGGMMPIGDTIATTWQKQQGIDYGKARLFGSLAFVIVSLLVGVVVGEVGESWIIWLLALTLALFSLAQMLVPSVGFQQQTQQQAQSAVSYWTILKDSTMLRMLLAAALIQSAHATYYTYSTIYWSENGFSTQQTSLMWGLAVVAEIGFFFFSQRLFKHWRIPHLMMLATVVAMVRWGIFAGTTEIVWVALGQLLHAATFGVTQYAMVRYISMQEVARIAKLQALYTGLASFAVMALFTFIAGIVYEHSPSGSFVLMIALVAPALWIVPKKLAVKVEN